MAKTKATKATKAKTVKVVVFWDDKGHYAAGGEYSPYHKTKPTRDTLLAQSDNIGEYGAEDLPHACIVDIELPIPEPLVGKVVKVKAVKT